MLKIIESISLLLLIRLQILMNVSGLIISSYLYHLSVLFLVHYLAINIT